MERSIVFNKKKQNKEIYYNEKYERILEKNKNQQIIENYNKYSKEPIEDKVILYESFHGKNMSDNPYALFKYMFEDPEYKNFLHVWAINTETFEIGKYKKYKNILFVRVHSDDYLYYLAKAKYLINNTSFPPYFCKREEQIYTNTWHGTPLKTLGKDMNGPIEQLKNLQRNFIQADFILSPNKFTTKKLINSHNLNGIYPGKVIESGYPRIDLVEKTSSFEILDKLKKHVNLNENKKIALYAPTWRGNVGKETDIKDEIKNIIVNMQKNLDDDYQLLLKVHPLLYKYFKNDKDILDVFIPDSIDMCETLSIVDLLITDYSSVLFDYYVKNKPIILYIYDKEEYLSDRGTYLDFEDLNCYIAEDESSLNDMISNVKLLKGCQVDSFINLQNGNVSKYVTNIIINDTISNDVIKFRNKKKNILFFIDDLKSDDSEKKITFINEFFNREKFNVIVLVKSNLDFYDERQLRKLKDIKLFFRFGSLNVDKAKWIEYMIAMEIGKIKNNESLLESVSEKEIRRLLGPIDIHQIYNLSNNKFWELILGYYPDVIGDKVQLINEKKINQIASTPSFLRCSFIQKFDSYISFDIESQKNTNIMNELNIQFLHINTIDWQETRELKKLRNDTVLIPVKDDNDLERFVLLENFNMDKEYLLIDGSNIHFEDIIDFYNLLNTYNFLSDYAVIIHGVNINTIEYYASELMEMVPNNVYIMPLLKNHADLLYLMKFAKYVFILEDFKYSIDKVYYLNQNKVNLFVTDKRNLLGLMFENYLSIHEWATFISILEKININSIIFDEMKDGVLNFE